MGWAPKTALKEGLVKTIAYFNELLSDRATKEMLSSLDSN